MENYCCVNADAIVPLISKGETQVIIQRHCKYDYNNGVLNSDSRKKQVEITEDFIRRLSDEELTNTYFLFIGSDSLSPQDFKRAISTSEVAMHTVQSAFKSKNLTSKVINLQANFIANRNVQESHALAESYFLDDNTGYKDYLAEKYGDDADDFWIAHELDSEETVRQYLGSEGPNEISNRVLSFLKSIENYAKVFHHEYPGCQLIVWNVTHADIMSPIIKREILSVPKDFGLDIDNCGGISYSINNEGVATWNLNNNTFSTNLQNSKNNTIA